MNDDRELMKALLGPDGPELTCEECFDNLDRYVELELVASDADAAIPGMHATSCSSCADPGPRSFGPTYRLIG